jgi:hypothetical protein
MLPPISPNVFPGFQPMRVSEEPVYTYLFRQNSVFTSLHLRSPVHVAPLLVAISLPKAAGTALFIALFVGHRRSANFSFFLLTY